MRAYGLERTTKAIDFAVREGAHPAILSTFTEKARPLNIGGYSFAFSDGVAAGQPQDEANVIFLLKLPAIDYPKLRETAKRHLGFLAGNTLDRLARLAGRVELIKEYELETGDA